MSDAPRPEEPLVSVTGYVVEVGAINMGRKSGNDGAVGVTLECGERDVKITGLDKAEARALGGYLRREVIIRIIPVTKP